MANSGKKTQKKKTPEKSASACGETIVKEKATGSLPKENGDLRTAIVDVLRNDDAVMQTIIDAVSEALVSKLLASKTFMSTLADKLLCKAEHLGPTRPVPWTTAARTQR